MQALRDMFSDVISNFRNITGSISFIDIIDIICVAILFYYLYVFIRNRRAGKLAVGILVLLVLEIISMALGMYLLQYILHNIFQVGVIMLVILFQPEIRSMLEKVGATPMKGLKSISDTRANDYIHRSIDEIVNAVCDMSNSKTGALIVFERGTKLGEVIATGNVIDANPSERMIENIFFNKAPMHDGALIIRNMRAYAAGCVLPLSSQNESVRKLGTRHRAGLGMSENSDAVVIIVSEETGNISTAVDGVLRRDHNRASLKNLLCDELIGSESSHGVLSIFSKKDASRKEKEPDGEN